MGEAASTGRFPELPHLFPYTFAVVTVTALVASNPDEGIRFANLTGPIGLSILAAVIGWAIGCLFSRRRTGQSLVALAFVLVVLAPGYLFGWTSRVVDPVAAVLLFVGLALIAFLAMAVAISRLLRLESTAPFLNAMSLILLAFTVPSIVRLLNDDDDVPLPHVTKDLPTEVTPRPDIYLITLDAYTGSRSLATIYGFDNSAFEDSLRARGFRLPPSSRANYTKTFLSVGSMLNRRYADELVTASAPDYADRRPAYRALELNQTAIDLKALGYTFHYIGSSYPPMASNRLAEGGDSTAISREFEALWLEMTLIPPVVSLWCHFLECVVSDVPFQAEDAADTESRIDRLMEAAGSEGPKFVYMHLLLPHGPFRFGPECEHRLGHRTIGKDAVSGPTVSRMFIDQVQCTNRKILAIVDRLHEASGDSAVVLLQADHGYGRFPGGIPQRLAETTDDRISERFDVFTAYAGPGQLADSLASVQTPVNLFRALFRVLWGVDERPLPDEYFWSEPGRPLDLIEVPLDSTSTTN